MTKRKWLFTTLLAGCISVGWAEEKTSVPLPKPAQITWQEAELTAVFHYDLHVFDGKQYNQAYNRITPIPDYIGIRWNSFLGVHDFMMPKNGTKFQENRQAFYNKMCEGMTEELMSRYGDLAIVWYDGGGHGPELGGADILPIVEKYH